MRQWQCHSSNRVIDDLLAKKELWYMEELGSRDYSLENIEESVFRSKISHKIIYEYKIHLFINYNYLIPLMIT